MGDIVNCNNQRKLCIPWTTLFPSNYQNKIYSNFNALRMVILVSLPYKQRAFIIYDNDVTLSLT